MPEWEMLRLPNSHMSGASYGACILHLPPRRIAACHPHHDTNAAMAGSTSTAPFQADKGRDVDFRQTGFGVPVKEPDIY